MPYAEFRTGAFAEARAVRLAPCWSTFCTGHAFFELSGFGKPPCTLAIVQLGISIAPESIFCRRVPGGGVVDAAFSQKCCLSAESF